MNIELLRIEIIEWMAVTLALAICIYVHERGHLSELRKKFPKAQIAWNEKSFIVGTDNMWRKMNREEKDDVLLNGFIVGFIPLFGLAILIPELDKVLVPYALYLVGSWNDIKLLSLKEW